MESVGPALAGRFLTTEPPGKSNTATLNCNNTQNIIAMESSKDRFNTMGHSWSPYSVRCSVFILSNPYGDLAR